MKRHIGILLFIWGGSIFAQTQAIAVFRIQPHNATASYISDGQIEAVKQAIIATQVSGQIVALQVATGDKVKSGQNLLQLDNQAALQTKSAHQAQVEAAKAELLLAKNALDRQRELFKKQYISQAALDQANAQFSATEANLRARTAQTSAASSQTNWYNIQAPFQGVVANLNAEIGDMVMPGRTLMMIFQPDSMRVLAKLPIALKDKIDNTKNISITPSGSLKPIIATSMQVLPTSEFGSQSVSIRLSLPQGSFIPGQLAKIRFPLKESINPSIRVPNSAVMQRVGFASVYVKNSDGFQLRMVRLGNKDGSSVEVLAGLSFGEEVAIDANQALMNLGAKHGQ